MRPRGLCWCGCGEATQIAKQWCWRSQTRPGQPMRYVKGHGKRQYRRVFEGYVLIRQPDHPRAINRYVFEHVLVVEAAIGRSLESRHVVHHVNSIRGDNRPANLCVLENQSEHMALHARLKVLRAGGDPFSDHYCSRCRTAKPADCFRFNATRRESRCIECARDQSREYQRRLRQRRLKERAA